jgi:internalin A
MKTLAMLVVAVFLMRGSAQSQGNNVDKSNAITAIKLLDGKVTLDEKKPGKPVISVNLSSIEGTDAGLVHLKGLTELQTLWLNETNATDAGVKKLQADLPEYIINQ